MASTLLVVDDSPTVLRIVESTLAGAGYRVLTASSGRAGLSRAKLDQPELILLDFVMPQMTGYQFCQQLAQDEQMAHIPVILMTSKGEPTGDRFASAPGVVDYVTKPFSPEVILALVSYTLEKQLRIVRQAKVDDSDLELDADTAVTAAPLAPSSDTQGSSPEQDQAQDLAQALERVLVRHGLGDSAEIARAAVREAQQQLPPAMDGVAASSAMLWADLSKVGLPEVLQLVSLQSLGGLFRIWGPRTRFDIYLKRGRVRAAQAMNADMAFRIGRFLVARNLISQTELEQLARSSSARGGLPLGEKLVRLGHIRAEDLKLAIADQCCELVYESLRVHGGRCCLLAGVHPPPEFDAMLVDIDVQGLLLEGLRRVDEWSVIEREVGGFDAVFAHRPSSMTDPSQFTSDERRLLTLVDGRRTVRDLVSTARMRPFEACKLLYRLAATKQIYRTNLSETGDNGT
ncbi:MAG: response regulator [Pseudomonadota bacterium]